MIDDEEAGTWISKAEVAEIPFTASTSKKNSLYDTGRLVYRSPGAQREQTRERARTIVRLVPPPRVLARASGRCPPSTVDRDRFNAVATDHIYRKHAIIERINPELKHDTLLHMPLGVSNANAARVAIAAITHNLLRTAVRLIGGRMRKVRAQSEHGSSASRLGLLTGPGS